MDANTDKTESLGSCCACCGFENVRNILMLPKKAPASVDRNGWGCFQCGLPMEGAVAVVCDACLESKAEVKFACVGYPAKNVRIAIGLLLGEHKHDLSKHPECAVLN